MDYEDQARVAERIDTFRSVVLEHYRKHGRDLPWRRTRDPYAILVSEVMLQQTQVARVLNKYEAFLASFPTPTALSAAPVARVLDSWQGLGYNRRALALKQTAEIIVRDHRGAVPDRPDALRDLPGVGAATAAAVCVFAYAIPLVFIETNIRTAIIHFFFHEVDSVPDSAILPLVEATLDRDDPRTWYYALMDYGAWVKREFANPGRRSRHHVVQSPFTGSRRQLRAAVLRLVLHTAPRAITPEEAAASLAASSVDIAQIRSVLEDLRHEGFLTFTERGYTVI